MGIRRSSSRVRFRSGKTDPFPEWQSMLLPITLLLTLYAPVSLLISKVAV